MTPSCSQHFNFILPFCFHLIIRASTAEQQRIPGDERPARGCLSLAYVGSR
uniref:Uncharacterized protein n=1 Tax=Arundo donax TaxID=35708 RepID=A0A0A9FPG7_ARUDO